MAFVGRGERRRGLSNRFRTWFAGRGEFFTARAKESQTDFVKFFTKSLKVQFLLAEITTERFSSAAGFFRCTDSSAVERLVYTEVVGGSNPSPCTIFLNCSAET